MPSSGRENLSSKVNSLKEMKILTWNINGIRAAGRGRSLKDILDSLEADVICLQETKVTRKCKMCSDLRQNIYTEQ